MNLFNGLKAGVSIMPTLLKLAIIAAIIGGFAFKMDSRGYKRAEDHYLAANAKALEAEISRAAIQSKIDSGVRDKQEQRIKEQDEKLKGLQLSLADARKANPSNPSCKSAPPVNNALQDLIKNGNARKNGVSK